MSNPPTSLHIFQQASIMIREKKDLGKTVTGNGKEVEGEVESSPGNEVQYEVTYVGTAQQVE